MRKKIVLVDNSTWNIYNFRLPLIRRLKSEGYEVVVVAPVDEFIHYLNDSHFTKHIALKHLSPQRTHPGQDALLIWELYRIYRQERPNLILHYTIKPNIYGNLAARMAGVRAISTITGLGYTFLHDSFIHRLIPHLYRMAFRSAHRVVFYNPDDRRLFEKRELLAPDQGFVIPGSGVNTNHFRPLPQPDTSKFIFLFIGRLLYDKGLREFVEAARRLRTCAPGVECWVIGELNPLNPAAVSKEEMVSWIEQQWIRYWGVAKDVRPYIKRAGAVVLPSYREGIPRSVLEGMAMGKPIITTDVAGCRETVAHSDNGYLVPVEDSRALAEAMEQLSHLPASEYERMGARSRERALQLFDEKIITRKYSRLIKEILHEGSQSIPAAAESRSVL